TSTGATRRPRATAGRSSTRSSPDDQNLERVRQVRRAAAAGRRRGLRGREVYLVRLLVDGNRARAALGGDVFEDIPLTARLLDDGQRAVTVRAECETGRGVERRAVGARTDRRRRDHLARVRVGDRHHAVRADREQAAAFRIDGEAGWTIAS